MKKLILSLSLLFRITTSSAQIDAEIPKTYVKIEPIVFGELHEYQANSINWSIEPFVRGSETVIIDCSLIMLDDKTGSTVEVGKYFKVSIPRKDLCDDTAVDDAILKYSPDFVKR